MFRSSKEKVTEITIPNHKVLSWNKLYASPHWTTRKKIADEIHELVWAYLPRPTQIYDNPVTITVVGHFKHKRRHDPDNIAAKVYIDALVGKLITDDSSEYVTEVRTKAIIGYDSDTVVISITDE